MRDKMDDKEKIIQFLESATLNDFKTIATLKAKVAELLDDADEGWAYASDYFRDKWKWDDRREEHLRFLKQFDIIQRD